MYTAWDLFKELWENEDFRDAWREDDSKIESAIRLAEEKVTEDDLSKVED